MFEITEKQISHDRLLGKVIENLMEERLFGVAYQKTRGTIEYDKREKELISLSNSIRDKIGSEQRLFMRYEELSTLNENVLLQNIYKKGFIDGVELLNGILIEGKTCPKLA